MGTIAKRLSRLTRANLTSARQELVIRAAAIGAWIPAVPRQLSQMPASVRDSLLARRGDFRAEALYDLIPLGVRMKADAAVAFLERRDLSHVESVQNAPELQSEITNVVFERMAWNRARGSDNMTKLELVRIRLDNFAEGVVQGAKATTAAAAKGAIVGALLELPISTVENLLLVRGRGKTLQEASVDVLKNVGKSAGAGAAGSMVVTGIALVGVPVGTMAVPLAVVGGTMYTWSAADRIWKARGLARLGREDGLFVREANQERCFGHSGRKDNMTQGISVFLPPVGGCLLVAALCVSTVVYVLTSVVDIVAVRGPILPL